MSNGINPAWNEILNSIPAEFHNQVIPTLQKWDQGFHSKLAEVRDEFKDFEAYKPLVEAGVDVNYAIQALQLADAVQENPENVMEQLNSTFDLGYLSKDAAGQLQAQPQVTDDDDFDLDGDNTVDITKHPQFQAMQQALESMQSSYDQDRQRTEEEQAIAEFQQYLDGLETQTKDAGLPFNRDFVTALVAQGISGEDAVKQFHQVLADNSVFIGDTQNNNSGGSDEQPVVMGGAGNSGSGSPDGSVDFGNLKKNDLNTTIEQILAQQLSSGQG